MGVLLMPRRAEKVKSTRITGKRVRESRCPRVRERENGKRIYMYIERDTLDACVFAGDNREYCCDMCRIRLGI